MKPEGKYIYAIIEADEPQEFGNLGIGGRGDKVCTACYKDLAAVVSSSPVIEYSVSRDTTLAHQRVLEKAMEKFTILPVRFGTIAKREEDIEEKVLKARYQEFRKLLGEMKDKVELGVRAIWTNMEAIFAELVAENPPIRRLKRQILKETSLQRAYAGKIKIGEMVAEALGRKKEREAEKILAVLRPLSVDAKIIKGYGDRNLLNAAFLVEKTKGKEFDRKIEELEKEQGERIKLKYFGPVPPYNFVEVVVTW